MRMSISKKAYINFNPRTPRGVRLRGGILNQERYRFQSTHPARGATITLQAFCKASE